MTNVGLFNKFFYAFYPTFNYSKIIPFQFYMEEQLLYHRLQFAFTITFHYLFPQLTMGLSLIIVFFKYRFLRTQKEKFNDAAKFFMKIFALNFLMGVITGIPMEFQFGTNWSKFSELTGGIIGQTLAMEGMFSFVMESSFLALFIFGEKWMSQKMHFLCGFMIFLGSWLSGYLILATNAWMQHPVGYEILERGEYVLNNFWALFSNPWLLPAYLHNQMASLVTSSFVICSIGAFYLLSKKHVAFGKLILRYGVIFGLISSVLVAFPTGDLNAKNVAKYQPAGFAAMEGIFETQEGGSEIALVGQPNMIEKKLDNEIVVPKILSFLTYNRWDKSVPGMNEFAEEELPHNIPALYYSYHIMVGLGTIFIFFMVLGGFFLWRKKLFKMPLLLWMIMLLAPFAYIANIAGWYTTELARQPWLVYGLLKTVDGVSPHVSSGNALFTLLGFVGLYLFLGLLFVILVMKIILKGPQKIAH